MGRFLFTRYQQRAFLFLKKYFLCIKGLFLKKHTTDNMKKLLLIISVFLSLGLAAFAQFKQTIIPYYDMEKELYGYKDSALNMAAIPAKFQYAARHSEGIARIQQNDKWGFIAFSGEEIVPAIYEDAMDMHDSLAAVKLDGKWGFIDRTGKVVIPIEYGRATSFSQERAAVIKEEFWGFIDTKGREVIPFIFGYDETITPIFKNGLANVKFRESWGYINTVGQIVVDFKYDYALPFDGDRAAVCLDYLWGFINLKGKEVIPVKYDIAGNTFPVFNEGLTPVNNENGYGYIDKYGKEVIPLIYDHTSNFDKGKAPVRMGSESFYIDTKGNRIQ